MSCGANGGGSGDGAPEETARTVKSKSDTREASNQEPSPPGDPLSTDIGGETSGAVHDASFSAPQRPGVQSGGRKKGRKRNIPLYTVGSSDFGYPSSNPSPVSERTTRQSDNAADQQFNLHEWPEVGQRGAATRSSVLDVSAAPDVESNSNQRGLCIDGSDVQVSEEGVGDITESTCDFSTRDVTNDAGEGEMSHCDDKTVKDESSHEPPEVPDTESNSNQPGLCIEEGVGDITESTCDFSTRDVKNDAGEGETSHCDDKTVKDESSHEPPEVPDTESNSNQPGLCIGDVQVSEESVGRGDCGADLNESTRDSSARDVTNNAGETSHCDDNTVKDESSHEPPEGIDSCIPSASVELERLSLGEENRVRSPGRGACEATSEQELQAFDSRVSHLALDTSKPGDALNPRSGEVSGCSSSGCFYATRDENGNVGDFYSPRTGLISGRALEVTYVHGCVCPFSEPVADGTLGDQQGFDFLESDDDSLYGNDLGLVESSMSEAVGSGAPFQQRQQNQSYQSYGGVSLHRSMSDQFQGGASSSRLMSDASAFNPFLSCPDIHGSLQRSLLSIAPAPIQDAGSRAVPPVPAQNRQHPGYWQNNARAVQRPAVAPGYPDYHGPQEHLQQQHGIGQSSQRQGHTAPPGYMGFYQPRAEFWIAQEYQQPQQQSASLPGGRGFHQQQQRAAPRGYQQRAAPQGYQQRAAPQGYQQRAAPQEYQQRAAPPQGYQQRSAPQEYQQRAAPQEYQQRAAPRGYQQRAAPPEYQQQGRGNGQRSQQQQQERQTFQEYQRELVDDWTAELWRNSMSAEQLRKLHRRRYGH